MLFAQYPRMGGFISAHCCSIASSSGSLVVYLFIEWLIYIVIPLQKCIGCLVLYVNHSVTNFGRGVVAYVPKNVTY